MHICCVLGGLALRASARPTGNAAAGAGLAIAVTVGTTVSANAALLGRTAGGAAVSTSTTLFGGAALFRGTTCGTVITAVAALFGSPLQNHLFHRTCR